MPRHFPLPLSPFEEYMMKDHHAAYPMVFAIRLSLQGNVDQARLETSVTNALQRHPLLRSTIERVGRNRHVWQVIPQPDVKVRCHEVGPDESQRFFPVPSVPDIRHDIGVDVRILRDRHAGNDDIVFLFVHMCCDGGGAFQFIEDVLVFYETPNADETHRLPSLDPDNLRLRHRRALTLADRWKLLIQQPFGLRGAFRFFVRYPSPLVDQSWPNLEAPPPDSFFTCFRAGLSAAELERLKLAARSAGVTTHELMMAHLYKTIAEIQSIHGNLHDGWIRLNIPTNLRRPEHQSTSAANIVSMVFVDRKPRHLEDWGRCLQDIHREMTQIKRFDVRYAYLYFSQLLQWIPFGYDMVSLSRKCHATMVMTNMGKVLTSEHLPRNGDRIRIGDATVTSLSACPPYRPKTSASLALMEYDGQLSLTMHFDPRAVAEEFCQELLSRFMERVRLIPLGVS